MLCASLHALWSCRQPTFPVLKALRNTIIYHLGSVALGAFIIAIIQFIRVRGGGGRVGTCGNPTSDGCVQCGAARVSLFMTCPTCDMQPDARTLRQLLLNL